MCQPGRPLPQGELYPNFSSFFHSAKSRGFSFLSPTSILAPLTSESIGCLESIPYLENFDTLKYTSPSTSYAKPLFIKSFTIDIISPSVFVAKGSISGFRLCRAFILSVNFLYQYVETSSGVLPSFSAFLRILSSTSVTLRQYVTS